MLCSISAKGLKACLSLLILGSTVSQASLYPTQPVAKTVFRAGHLNNVTWIDSPSEPSLSKMGPMKIALCMENDKCLGILAENVEPRTMQEEIYISPTIGANASNYHLRFIFDHPHSTVYSADFSINGMTGSSAPVGNSVQNTLSPSPLSTAPTVLDAKQGTQAADEEMVTVTMEATPGAPGNPQRSEAPSAKTNNAASAGRPLRKSSTQINLVFVLWPALFGIALAL